MYLSVHLEYIQEHKLPNVAFEFLRAKQYCLTMLVFLH